MPQSTKKLHKAKALKNDEYYTLAEDIQLEICHYWSYFENKVVLCNCNDSLKSEFWKYFLLRFNLLKLKKLIVISYGKNSVAYKYDGHQINKIKLNNNGSFKSFESIQYLRQSDIVVTNPPFSKFREFINLLIDFNKKFLIIGPLAAIAYIDVFNHIKNNKIWIGFNTGNADFIMEDGVTKKQIRLLWYTNLGYNKKNNELILNKKYNPDKYPKYDNYNAINVNKTKDIPKDYYDDMGVPISFLTKWNPEQFKIIKKINPIIDGKRLFWRLIIKRRVNENRT